MASFTDLTRFLHAIILTVMSQAFHLPNASCRRMAPPSSTSQQRFAFQIIRQSASIDFQSDESEFGRGEMHLSAILEEGDVVVFQTGSWFVDGVAVGEDVPPSFEYCCIETIQLVWTHNCEHGVLRGCRLHPEIADDGSLISFSMDPDYEQVEFGPEQLLARVPVEWTNDEMLICRPLERLTGDMWNQYMLG